MNALLTLAEKGLLPDAAIRMGIRALLRERLREVAPLDEQAKARRVARFAESLRRAPIAVETDKANEQHYEVPASFFAHVLGPRLKYSSCLYSREVTSLSRAEDAMLALTCRRAGIRDGVNILELGCGWGSLTLWMAERFPNSSIHAVSNSATQREFILARARERRLCNLRVTTCDVNTFQPGERYDRIVSVEMFEHLRNYDELFARIATWLAPQGRLFVHVFCHRSAAYAFETEGSGNWLGRHFFTGGIMPSRDLFSHFSRDLAIERQWNVSGLHYMRTAEDWLSNMDRHRRSIIPILSAAYGSSNAALWFQRWRIFFMACAELWGFARGREWHVAHYLFRHNTPSAEAPGP